MSGEPEPRSPRRVSRRGLTRGQLLRGAVATGVGLVAAACVPGLEKGTKVEYNQLEPGKKILEFNGQKVDVKYDEGVTHAFLRADNQILRFRDGDETVRMVGEITDNHIVQLQVNPKLSLEEINTGIWQSPYPPKNLKKERLGQINSDEIILGVRVITWPQDLIFEDETKPVLEKNVNCDSSRPSTAYPGEFGSGWLLGRIDEETGVFQIQGYVCDQRALTPVKVNAGQ